MRKNGKEGSQPLRIAMCGLGTVGSGVAKLIFNDVTHLEQRAGRRFEFKHIVVRDPARVRNFPVQPSLIHGDAERAVSDPDVDVVIELIGGIDKAKEIVIQALKNGKDVVTANKALLSIHGSEIFDVARTNGQTVCFEAAVAGGIPIISGLTQGLAANQFSSIEAILNGTSNFILSTMSSTGSSFQDVVEEAQRLGYAEADPSMDVDGTDAAQKLSILVQLAFGEKIQTERIVRQGIESLDAADLSYAKELGYVVKLLAVARVTDGQLELHVQPTLIRAERPVANVDGPLNMIAAHGDAVGTVWWSGPGAGQMATASSVVADLIDLAVGRAQITFKHLNLWKKSSTIDLLPPEKIVRRSYFRFHVEDRPHVVADIADILGRHQISLASIIQHESPELPNNTLNDAHAIDGNESRTNIVPLVVMTHRATEGQLRAAEVELDRLTSLRSPWVRMPVTD